MNPPDPAVTGILRALQERAKELECLYRIDELLKRTETPLPEILERVVQVIPPGWQYPQICQVRATYEGATVQSPDFHETPWVQEAPIVVEGRTVGTIQVSYREQMARSDEGPFLKEERKLINTIAERLGHFIEHQALESAYRSLEAARHGLKPAAPGQWRIILEFLKSTDHTLLVRISRKMLNHLCWMGIREAVALLHTVAYDVESMRDETDDANRPLGARRPADALRLTAETFAIATEHMSEEQILACIQQWIREDRGRFFVTAVGNPDSTMDEITDAIRHLHHIPAEEIEFPEAVQKGLRVSLIEHFFTDDRTFVNVAKRVIDLDSYYDIAQHVVYPPRSHGKLGGKSAGLFLAAQILKKHEAEAPLVAGVKTPKTWYITTDGIIDFIQYNDLEEVYNQKYADIDQVRAEYPHIVQMFKNSTFSPPMVNGLSILLDDLEGRPLIVRSSSLLEDRFGAAFSGKYKSLFLANGGSKRERLAALMDAIAEVYASTFAPDPIEYRSERGLIDVYEEMGILVQEVVGTEAGRYYLPAFSGVAFSRNEFRWSPRIKREDGLVRLVAGLGTRAVDRLKDDYPVLLAPGQPNLRVNLSLDEIIKYSPKKIDLIDLETGAFTTVDLTDFLRTGGTALPRLGNMVSIVEEDRVRRPLGREWEMDPGRVVLTFEGLVDSTPFVRQIQAILATLEGEIGSPVDIEFASDGRDLYLLQCRPQSAAQATASAQIPRDLAPDRIIFNARRFVSNGAVPAITHIVYVDPDRYDELESLEDLKAVGRAVGRLNKMLPKRQFILMGPGRWGSRGDIKLGVNVTYSDINNTAVLIEIARKKGKYLPDLSFGTHFFQDLVEASIRYLPLYPDEQDIVFREDFLRGAKNILPEILPEIVAEHRALAEVVRVIDVPKVADGMILRVLMNADQDEAVAYLAPPQVAPPAAAAGAAEEAARSEAHWRWRLRFAEQLAAELDPERFGVKACYLIGSTKNATAGPASDIDLIIHFGGTEDERAELMLWLEGWSRCLGEINFLRTGYRTDGLLDVHLITDEDIAGRTSFAMKIGAVTDPARKLAMKGDGGGDHDLPAGGRQER